MVCGYIICSSNETRPSIARSYYKVIELGYLTKDPAAYHDPNVCAKYIKPPAPKPAGTKRKLRDVTVFSRSHSQARKRLAMAE